MDIINFMIILLIFYGHIKIFFLDGIDGTRLEPPISLLSETADTVLSQGIPVYHYGQLVRYLELK